MDVRCERCNTEYEFDEAKVTEAGVTVKCANCGNLFKVRRRPDSGNGHAQAAPAPTLAPQVQPAFPMQGPTVGPFGVAPSFARHELPVQSSGPVTLGPTTLGSMPAMSADPGFTGVEVGPEDIEGEEALYGARP